MSATDEKQIRRGSVMLVDKIGNPIGKAAERSPIAPKRRDPTNVLHDYVTREEMIKGASNAAIAVGGKMYEQFSEETGDYLREMEQTLRNEIRLEFERRTLRGKLRAFWYRLRDSQLGAVLMELGLIDPLTDRPELVVDADVALDPNVQSAAATREKGLTDLRKIVESRPEGGEITLPEGTTARDAYEIDRALHPEAYAT
jgi:hypothetical protein